MDAAKDHSRLFSPVAGAYAQFRPRYPEALFDHLTALVPHRQFAWDAGCGSGQATLGLADRFVNVLGTDINAAQIAAAPAHPHVVYRVGPEKASGLEAGSVALVTVAQALHWFDLDAFHAEVQRVLTPRGVIAAWSYGVVRLQEPVLDEIVQHFYRDVVGPFWPAERRHVENDYRDLPFPYAELTAPSFDMEVHWHLPQFLGYLGSWSATARYIAANQQDPTVTLAERLLPAWGDPYQSRVIRWPLALRIGRLGG
ncbi:class I SAM-dependent methyltransferase [Uliginosibacterium sp. H1]|uniref:class I SAM-dependent methyltransferase n=1 Tax=Uliginosibacterium sp. H1 TaxID=3114757 RepID=UPI002E1839D1|nr:class I SAM-dependent methyltransferase [Uliginosibacterium sp. H1]